MKKRWLAMLMAAIMCLSLLPMSALATESSPPEPPDDSGSSTETVNKTITVDDSFTDGKLVEGSTYATIQAAIDYIAVQEDSTGWTINVAPGTYTRFTVLRRLDNLTIVGDSADSVIINVLDNSAAKIEGANDYQGVHVNAGNFKLTNVTLSMGTYSTDWNSAAIAIANGSTTMPHANGLVLDRCKLVSTSGVGFGIFMDNEFDSFSITNCTFGGMAQGIYMENTASHPVNAKIESNTFKNCSFAFHGSYASSSNTENGSFSFNKNTIQGTENLRCKFILQDTNDENCVKVEIAENNLLNSIIGLVNLRGEGETVSDVLNSNSFDDGSFYVEAMEPGTIEFYTTYQAPNNDEGYWKLTGIDDIEVDWGGNPEGSLSHIQQAINEANANGSHTLSITGIDEENLIKTFTWFKDAIYWVSGTPDGSETTDKWDEEHSKSKSATNLDKNYESQVTLSLPSAEEELVSDVVFVLDKSTSAALEEQALNMLQNLKKQVNDTNAKVKVGVVIFNKEANVANDGNFFDLSTQYGKIENAIKQNISSGTNTHAGLLAGKAMLDGDTSVDANRKYLIFVSDGITYMYNAEPTAIALTNGDSSDGKTAFAGPDNWSTKYGNNDAPEDWTSWLNSVGTLIQNDQDQYDLPYEKCATNVEKSTFVVSTDAKNHAMAIDKALYLTNQVYQEAQNAGYHCYAMSAGTNSGGQYVWGPSFMEYLAGGNTVTFESIQNDIFYLLDAGSTVTDVIGSGTDNKGTDYDFDFVNDVDKLTLKVGEDTYTTTKGAITETDTYETARYTFTHDGMDATNNADAPFVLHYYENGVDGNSAEHFVWDINVPVTNFAPVSLTYTVKLTNPQSASGTYGEWDQYGENKKTSLYTNNRATLSPVDSNGNVGELEWFAKPTVSYTVKSSGGGGGGGGSNKPPVLNTEDHFGYIIGYPEHYLTGEACHDQTLMPVKPEGNITRAEVATIFFRMLTDDSRNEFWSQTSSYSDVELDDWFNNAICTLSNAGVINGYEDGTFKPNGKITRAEAVTIVNRTLDRHPDQENFLEDMLVWPDNMDTEKWYYADMQEATNSHEYQMKTKNGEKYEVWTKMLPIRDWEAFEKAWSDANSSNNPGEVVK